ELPLEQAPSVEEPAKSPETTNQSGEQPVAIQTFDVSEEAKNLIEISKHIESKIPESQWKEIAGKTIEEKYIVQEGEWLWKISQRLFGSGFYYAKIWSLNPYITNPHEIKPGMVLLFNTG